MVTKEIEVGEFVKNNELPLAKLVQIACEYNSRLLLKTDELTMNLKSIMGVMNFAPSVGDKITLQAEGEDEKEALHAIEAYIS